MKSWQCASHSILTETMFIVQYTVFSVQCTVYSIWKLHCAVWWDIFLKLSQISVVVKIYNTITSRSGQLTKLFGQSYDYKQYSKYSLMPLKLTALPSTVLQYISLVWTLLHFTMLACTLSSWYTSSCNKLYSKRPNFFLLLFLFFFSLNKIQ